MMVKSILLDQNAKGWYLELPEFAGFLSGFIDEKSQMIKLYYATIQDHSIGNVHVVDCGTNQDNPLVNNGDYSFICSLTQHEGNIVHHLFWDFQ